MAAPITAGFKDSDWLLNNFNEYKKMVEKATMESKTEGTMWKSMTLNESGADAGVKSDLAICLRSLNEKTVFQEKNGLVISKTLLKLADVKGHASKVQLNVCQ